jgi:hypothetical protein
LGVPERKEAEMKVKITFTEELLGTASADPEIHAEFIASKGPNAQTLAEEVEALGEAEVIEKAMTIFPRDADGDPSLWDYQVKGFFKDACGMLARAKGTKSSALKAYRKIIDGLIFVAPRQIKLVMPPGGKVGSCQRPLRAQTAQGERIALAHSETVPAGTTIEIDITAMELGKADGKVTLEECVAEWLTYGALRGFGQWRNSGKGRFTWEKVG